MNPREFLQPSTARLAGASLVSQDQGNETAFDFAQCVKRKPFARTCASCRKT